jgi:hypothetical protein
VTRPRLCCRPGRSLPQRRYWRVSPPLERVAALAAPAQRPPPSRSRCSCSLPPFFFHRHLFLSFPTFIISIPLPSTSIAASLSLQTSSHPASLACSFLASRPGPVARPQLASNAGSCLGIIASPFKTLTSFLHLDFDFCFASIGRLVVRSRQVFILSTTRTCLGRDITLRCH